MTFKEQIEKYLDPLPSEWREKLTTILCEINNSRQTPDCQQLKECETVTSLSPFTIDGSNISIQYKDEKGVTTTRSADLKQLIGEKLTPGCLTDANTWEDMDLTDRIQMVIDKHCDCCSEEVIPEIITVNYTEDTYGTGSPDNLNTLFNIPVEAGQTIYFEGDFTINTESSFFTYAEWYISDFPDGNKTEWTFTEIVVNGVESLASGTINDFDVDPGQSATATLYIKGSVKNISDLPVSIKFMAYTYNSYFSGYTDHIFLAGSFYKYSTAPF